MCPQSSTPLTLWLFSFKWTLKISRGWKDLFLWMFWLFFPLRCEFAPQLLTRVGEIPLNVSCLVTNTGNWMSEADLFLVPSCWDLNPWHGGVMSVPHPMTQITDLLVMTSGLHWKPRTWFLLLQQFELLPRICAGKLHPVFIPLYECFSITELRPL